MSFSRTAAFTLLLIFLPSSVSAQLVEEYLTDKVDTALRVELVAPPEALEQKSFWQRLQSLLGVRTIFRIRPKEGTKLVVQSSAYAPSPYQTDATPCVTAAGTRVRPGVVATNFLPLGTILEINGQRYIVEDRMNSRYDGYYLDIWFPSTTSALEFGRRKIEITIVGYGEVGQVVRPEKKEAATTDAAEETLELSEEEASVWENVKKQVSTITTFLTARLRGDVNKYDVDCFSESPA